MLVNLQPSVIPLHALYLHSIDSLGTLEFYYTESKSGEFEGSDIIVCITPISTVLDFSALESTIVLFAIEGKE